jgi:hypothetical protein
VTTDFLGTQTRYRQRADGATLCVFFVVALMIVPARMVFKGIPLSLTPANVMALGIGMCWLAAHFTTTLGIAKGRSPVRTALFLYVTALLCTFGYSTFGYLPSDELNLSDHAAVLIIALVVLALGMCDGVRGLDRIDFVLKAVVVAGALVSIVGIFQFLVDVDLTKYLQFPGLRYTSEDGFITVRNGMRRVAGTTGHPIEFGVLCSMVLPIAAHYGFHAPPKARLRWWTCAALLATGLMFSISRSAVLGFLAVGVVLLIGWPAKRRLQAIGVACGFLVVIKFVSPGLLGTFYGLFANSGNDDSVRYRTHDYAVAAEEIARHMWLGRGVGTWYAPKHQVFDNQYILTAVESGLVGIAVFAGLFLTAIYSAVRARYLSVDDAPRDLGLTLAACLVVPLAGSATFDLLSFATVTGLTFLLIGTTGALLRTAEESRADRLRTTHLSRETGPENPTGRGFGRADE